MTKSNLPKSLKKYIRREKARIRREVLDSIKQKTMIDELYRNVYRKNGKIDKKTKVNLEKVSKIQETSQLS